MTEELNKLNEDSLIARAKELFIKDEEEEIRYQLNKDKLNDLNLMLNSNDLGRIKKILSSPEKSKNFSFVDLVDLDDSVKTLHNYISDLKQEIEFIELQKSGQLYNWDKIRKRYDQVRFKDEFKNFNWKVYKERIINPTLELEGHNGTIYLDPFVVRKLNQGLHQMIFNNQDLWSFITGIEGAGKSLTTSNKVFYCWDFLKAVGLIDYEFDLNELIYTSINEMLDDMDGKYKDTKYRLYWVDEGEDLDRGNSRGKDNKRFKRKIRRCRKLKSIAFICSPQIGEIDIAVTLARITFIFYSKLDYDSTTGLLNQGEVDMYVIPKTKRIFSDRLKTVLTRSFIKNRFMAIFDNKSTYYSDLPQDCVVKTFKVNGIWPINEMEYDKIVTSKNTQREEEDNDERVKLTIKQEKALVNHLPKLSFWKWDTEINSETLKEQKTEESRRAYELLTKFVNGLKKKYDKVR